MELLPKIFYGNLKRSLRRRGYKRLDTSRKKISTIRIEGSKSSRLWKIKSVPRLRLKSIVFPLKLFTKLKSTYMNMMISLAVTVGSLNTQNVFGGKKIPKAHQVPLGCKTSKFEAKLIIEIYKSLIASGELKATRVDRES